MVSQIVVSDLHLGARQESQEALALKRAVSGREQAELVLLGDSFDLSRKQDPSKVNENLEQILRDHPELKQCLREHLLRGSEITLVAGNHDPEIVSQRARAALLQWLDLQSNAKLSCEPWFIQRNGVHLEHGHLFDPDNAPTHPLVPWSAETEPLGIALTRRFLAPNRVWEFAHAHETKPLSGLARTFKLYGRRAPRIVFNYFHVAIAYCLRAGRQPGLLEEQDEGQAALSAFAADDQTRAALVAELLAGTPEPRHHSFAQTFERLYFDRIIGSLALGPALAAALGGSALGGGIALTALLGLAWSMSHGIGRFDGEAEERLRLGAGWVRKASGAETVVLGHTHREETQPGYFNTGSFAFCPENLRPFLTIDNSGKVERHYTSSA